jgi:hypothetical protein
VPSGFRVKIVVVIALSRFSGLGMTSYVPAIESISFAVAKNGEAQKQAAISRNDFMMRLDS